MFKFAMTDQVELEKCEGTITTTTTTTTTTVSHFSSSSKTLCLAVRCLLELERVSLQVFPQCITGLMAQICIEMETECA